MDVKWIQLSHPSSSTSSSVLNIRPTVFTHIIRNHFHFHPQRWKCQVPNGQIPENDLVHGVKEGESLTIYETDAAAASKDIVALDLIFEAQLLSIVPLSLKMRKEEVTGSSKSGKGRGLGLCNRCLKEKMLSALSSSFPHPPHAKTTGYFLVLVPLIAFCIRLIMGALHNKLAGDLKHNDHDTDDPHLQSKRTRWRSALQELSDPDATATDISPSHDHSTEDEEEITEDLSHNYTKLESDYAKFLSECGISDCGYWRGGSPK